MNAYGYIQDAIRRLESARTSYEETTREYINITRALGYLQAAANAAYAEL